MREIIYGPDRIKDQATRLAFINACEVISEAYREAFVARHFNACTYLAHVELALQDREFNSQEEE